MISFGLGFHCRLRSFSTAGSSCALDTNSNSSLSDFASFLPPPRSLINTSLIRRRPVHGGPAPVSLSSIAGPCDSSVPGSMKCAFAEKSVPMPRDQAEGSSIREQQRVISESPRFRQLFSARMTRFINISPPLMLSASKTTAKDSRMHRTAFIFCLTFDFDTEDFVFFQSQPKSFLAMRKDAVRTTKCVVLAMTCLAVPTASFLTQPLLGGHGRLIFKAGSPGRQAVAMSLSHESGDCAVSRRHFTAIAGALFLSPAVSYAKPTSVMNDKQSLADKQALFDAISVVQSLESKVKEPSSWQQIADIVTKPPYTKEAFDKLFIKASKTLPDNIQKIYGGDGGQWVGVKNEVQISTNSSSLRCGCSCCCYESLWKTRHVIAAQSMCVSMIQMRDPR
jgi:hypothetical protein